jgi:hypothetical protein
MKLEQLRKIIREEVKSAIKEELQDMLNEAVKVASTPSVSALTKKSEVLQDYKPVTQKDISQTWSTGKLNTGTIPLEEMLNATAKEMSSEDYKNVINADSTQAPNFAKRAAGQLGRQGGGSPGVDLSSIPGLNLSKSKAILDAAMKKDKVRHGN